MSLLGLSFQLGCGGEDSAGTISLDVSDTCNPLGGESCLMPWPSSVYLTEADTATGVQLNLPAEAMPVNFDGIAIDPAPYNRFDGFSPSGPIFAVFEAGVSAAGLPPHNDPAASLRDDSATVLYDMTAGKRVLHFAEVDANALYPEERALIIRPLERLAPGSRIAVAIRKSVRAEDGSALPVSPAFAALLDGAGAAVAHPLMTRLTPRYDAIFSALEGEGVPREDLVLAWDFVTASDEFLTRDLLAMRKQAMPILANALQFTAGEVPSDPGVVLRSLVGTHQAPNFLTDGEEEESVLLRDSAGEPMTTGMYDANFAAVLPACVNDPNTVLPIPVVIFGHGLFGSGASYAQDTLLPLIANQFCMAVVAGDFIGLTSRQVSEAANAANNLNNANRITEKLAQSVINFMTLRAMIGGSFATASEFQFQGEAILDPGRVYYLGASLGGIMGNVVMAYDPVIERGVLGVPGGAWGLLFERSLAWGLLQVAARAAYRDEVASFQVLVSLLAMRFEPYDPITTARQVIGDPLPDTPAKELLLYEAIGDSLVSNLSTEMTARTMGLPVLGPTVRSPHGLEVKNGPLASALVIYDEHRTPLPPETNVPPNMDNGTHGGVNERNAVLGQVIDYLLTGEINSHCLDEQGVAQPCDCATGVCD